MQATTLAPAITVVRAKSRLRTETSWLDSWHCFSYGRYYEPDNTLSRGDSVRLTAAGSPEFTVRAPDGAEMLVWETG